MTFIDKLQAALTELGNGVTTALDLGNEASSLANAFAGRIAALEKAVQNLVATCSPPTEDAPVVKASIAVPLPDEESSHGKVE